MFFGNENYYFLILPLVVLLVGYGFHSIFYGYLRGKGQVLWANGFQLLNIGILPVMVLAVSKDVQQYLYFNALFIFASSLFFSGFVFYKNSIAFNLKLFKEDSSVLLSYGIPRVFGDFALLALLTIPTYIVLYVQHDLLAGGDIAYALTLFNIVGAAFGPLSLVLLPEISKFLSESKFNLIKQRFYFFVFASVALTALGYLIFVGFHHFILSLLLGSNYRPEIFEIAKVVLLGSFGYVVYIVLRSFLDAIHVKAKNATNLLISLAIYLIMVLYGSMNNVGIVSYLYYFVVAVNILGLLTFIQTFYTIKKLK
jgi:O-antigen/teichoic acid export membrane protein